MVLYVQHVEEEGPGLLKDFFDGKGLPGRILRPYDGDIFPPSFDGIEALVFMGGPMNVYEHNKYPFLVKEKIFIKKAVELGIPLIGICLGAQLLSVSLGGMVIKSPEKEVGFYTVNKTAAGEIDTIFQRVEDEFPVFQWHEDTFTLPPGSELLARSDNGIKQAFRVKRAYGFQFHVEATGEMIGRWMAGHLTGGEELEEFLEESGRVLPRLADTGKNIFGNFYGHITGHGW
jgi:GMP synthase-like glutamine amidotransferase